MKINYMGVDFYKPIFLDPADSNNPTAEPRIIPESNCVVDPKYKSWFKYQTIINSIMRIAGTNQYVINMW